MLTLFRRVVLAVYRIYEAPTQPVTQLPYSSKTAVVMQLLCCSYTASVQAPHSFPQPRKPHKMVPNQFSVDPTPAPLLRAVCGAVHGVWAAVRVGGSSSTVPTPLLEISSRALNTQHLCSSFFSPNTHAASAQLLCTTELSARATPGPSHPLLDFTERRVGRVWRFRSIPNSTLRKVPGVNPEGDDHRCSDGQEADCLSPNTVSNCALMSNVFRDCLKGSPTQYPAKGRQAYTMVSH